MEKLPTGNKKMTIDLGDTETTIAETLDLALPIGEAARPGTGPAIMANHLRDLSHCWVTAMEKAVREHYSPYQQTVGLIRTYAALISLTLMASADRRNLDGAIETCLEIIN